MVSAPAVIMSKGVRRFTDLRAWQACRNYKLAVYRMVLDTPLNRDWKRREQLEKSVAGPPAHIAEGFGRFNPPDAARFAVTARASLMESQDHLIDAVDKGYLTEEARDTLNALCVVALQEVTGWMEYLQSEEALKNARRARERRIASRAARRAAPQPPKSPQPSLQRFEPEPEPEPEPRRENQEE